MPVRIHQGSTPEALQKHVESRPFTRQLDVVLTEPEELTGLLSALRASYYRSTMTFAEMFSIFDAHNSTLALSVGTWSIDHRAILTLHLARDTYESLGIVGTPLRAKDMFQVTLDLHSTSRLAVRSRDRLRQWDAARAEAGKHGWDVILSSPVPSGNPAETAVPLTRVSQGVRIPSPVLPLAKSEDAHEELSELFEWVGMAALGSQRILVNDAVNPYIASCSFPDSWPTGSLTHIRWAGLLTPAFVQSVLDICLRCTGLFALTATPLSHDESGVWTLITSKVPPTRGDWVLAECHK